MGSGEGWRNEGGKNKEEGSLLETGVNADGET